ncbi:hypothetical protein EV121DRAFT_277275 [Schizophyllum commune]
MGSLVPTRTCNSCRTVIDDPSYQYKACTKCLEKSRAYGKRYKEKKKLEKEQRDGLQLSAATSGKSTKVKSESKAKIQLSAQHEPLASEYCNAQELFAWIKRTHIPRRQLTFEGCYRIVDIDQNHAARVIEVAQRLRDETSVSFALKPFKRATNPQSTRFTSKYRCLCGKREGDTSSASAPQTGKPKLNGTGNLKVWMSQAKPSTDCGGEVSIAVCKDTSHKILPGQRITITISHDTEP